MPRLFYHPGSDSLWVEQYHYIDWSHLPGEEVDDVSGNAEMVSRYNREVPGYPVHLFHGHENCNCNHDRCTICDGGLAFCVVCRQGECEVTTDCPGSPPTEEQNAAVCAGKLDYWSGVWL
jgi:hypothetical protein